MKFANVSYLKRPFPSRTTIRNASYASNANLLLNLDPPSAPNPKPKPVPKPEPPSSSSTSTSSTSSTARNPYTPPKEIPSTLPKPRLDYKKIIDAQKAITINHVLRNSPCHPDTVFHINRLYETSVSLHRKMDSVRAKQKDVGTLIKAGGGEEAKRQAKKLKLKVIEYEKILEETDSHLLELGGLLPNDTHPLTPVGKESCAIEMERFGPRPIEKDKKRDHLDLSTAWGLVDPPASALATGTSWPYLKGTLAILEQALIQYAMRTVISKGWIPISTPDVIKEDIMTRCGFQPRDEAGQTYFLTTTPPQDLLEAQPGPEIPTLNHLVLTATAEIPLAALSANKIIPHSSLPLKYVALGKAFRAEAGARGADTRGLYRLHQFNKVELFAVTEGRGEVSERMMSEIKDVQREINEGLGLSVRVLDMPTEELGASAYRKYDMEAWMPGRGEWGEISSTSNCTDYQARRLHIRHRPGPSSLDQSIPFAHTLNGTCAAIPRLLIALVENGVQFDEEGKPRALELPDVLRGSWMGPDRVNEEIPIVWKS